MFCRAKSLLSFFLPFAYAINCTFFLQRTNHRDAAPTTIHNRFQRVNKKGSAATDWGIAVEPVFANSHRETAVNKDFCKKKPDTNHDTIVSKLCPVLAEREGFEPSVGY